MVEEEFTPDELAEIRRRYQEWLERGDLKVSELRQLEGFMEAPDDDNEEA